MLNNYTIRTMETSKLSKYLIIGLIVLNLCLIAFILMPRNGRPPFGKPEGPKNIIIEKLNLDKSQINAYEVLIAAHRRDISNAQENQNNLKKQLYLLLSNKVENTNQKDSLLLLLADNQRQTELIHYNHFNEIKLICRPNQMQAYHQLVLELQQLFDHNKPKKHD